MKNILFFTSFPPPNTGASLVTEMVYKFLSIGKNSVDIINTVDSGILKRKSGIFTFQYFFRYIYLIFRLFRKINMQEYEYVYLVYSSTKLGLIRDIVSTFVIKNFSNAKLVAHIHSGNYGLKYNSSLFKPLFSYILSKIDKLVFLSESLNHIQELIPVEKIVYLPNMVSPELRLQYKDVLDKIDKIKNVNIFKIIYISNLIESKGFWDLIKAIDIVVNEYSNKNIRLNIIGGGESKIFNEIESFIKERKLEEQIFIFGPINERQKIKDHFNDAHLFILPTYYSLEAQPLSIIEAFNSGTPVISTFHASIPEMIDDFQNGYLVPTKEPVEIAKRISYLFSNRKMWADFALKAREAYDKKFHHQVFFSKLEKIFTYN